MILFSLTTERPQIIPFTFEENITPGRMVQVACVVSQGDLPIEIRWTLEGEEIRPASGIFTQRISERTSILSINSVGSEHRGSYTCHASNAAGVTNVTKTLWINGNTWYYTETKVGNSCVSQSTSSNFCRISQLRI